MNKYISAEELTQITGLKTRTCLKIINQVRETMKEKHYFIPNEKTKYALRTLVFEYLGIKEK